MFTAENLITLFMLTMLQAVLGFGNLLYISLESKKVAEESPAKVRKIGIALAIILRIILLFAVLRAIDSFQNPFFSIDVKGWVEGDFNIHSVIVLIGGIFIIYTALKEIYHMISLEEHEECESNSKNSVGKAIFWIVIMNLVFSFDTILSAIALTKVFWVMASGIVISGVLMIVMADTVSEFLKKNRMYEILGLFILLIVGVMLLSEGGHLAHLKFAGYPIEPMSKATFYFVIVTLVLIDMAQGRYQKKLLNAKKRIS